MTPPVSIYEMFSHIPVAAGFITTTGSIVAGGVLLGLLTWFAKNAIDNQDTPRRLSVVEQDIREIKRDLSDINANVKVLLERTPPLPKQTIAGKKSTRSE